MYADSQGACVALEHIRSVDEGDAQLDGRIDRGGHCAWVAKSHGEWMWD